MSEHSGRVVRRAPVLAAVAVVLVAGALVDRVSGPAPAGSSALPPVPVLAPAAALSTTWFCAGATDGGSLDAPGYLDVAHDGPGTLQATLTLVPSTGATVRQPFSVGPYSTVTEREAVPAGAPWVGAIVDVDGGSVAVGQEIDSNLGRSTSPCATSGSSSWYFASGQTRINADQAVLLLNPYPTLSIVDLSFSTDQGIESPQNFQGISVPADGLVAVDVGSQLRRRASIATTVHARTGEVVAWQTSWAQPPQAGQVVVGTPAASAPLADPATPYAGIISVLGSPSAATQWTWPDGLAGQGIDERYVIYNPGSGAADVRLSVGLAQGSAEPFDLTVGPYQVVPVVSAQQARIPAGVAHSAVLTSLNGVPVVAERVSAAASGSAGAGPVRNGFSDMPGARLASGHWVVPVTGADAAHSGSVTVYDPGPDAVQVRLSALSQAGGAAPVPVGSPQVVRGGQRLALAVPAGTTALVLDATAPVYVESDLFGSGVNGMSNASAVPAG